MTLGVVRFQWRAPSVDERKEKRKARADRRSPIAGTEGHLGDIRAKLSPEEVAVFDRGVERMRQTPGALARIVSLSVDDAIADLRFEMRCNPLIARAEDPL